MDLNMRNIRPVVRKTITPNPLFIDGPSRSGKGAVSVAVSGLDRTEHIATRYIIDRLITFYSLGLMDRDATIDSIATEVDLRLWKNYLGRDLNTNIT
jgi:cytidylate kinase